MKQFPNLTLKRVQKRNRKISKRYSEDHKTHETVEQGSIGKEEFLGVIKKVIKP